MNKEVFNLELPQLLLKYENNDIWVQGRSLSRTLLRAVVLSLNASDSGSCCSQ